MHQDKDRGAQWLFSHFGLGILKLAGVAHIAECRAIKEGLVAPRRMPDGLMEVTFTDRPEKSLFLVEIESYASADADRQMLENLTVVVADRREMPEAIILVLRPKGNAQVSGQHQISSQNRSTSIQGNWRVIQLWDLNATDLLAQNDIGLIPWVPLTHIDAPVDEVIRECRERIDRDAPEARRAGLLAVTQIMAGFAGIEERIMSQIAFDSPLFDSPYIRKLKDEFARKLTQEVTQEVTRETLVALIEDILAARFQNVPDEPRVILKTITDEARLKDLHRWAAICPDLDSFRDRLTQVAP